MDYHDFAISFRRTFGVDLSGYKINQMQRRINHFIERCKCTGYEHFLQVLTSDQETKKKFMNYLTINVTEFFRNPEYFLYLEKEILLDLINKTGTLKIWSAACSNGAEPYSLAIIMQSSFPGKSFKIDATDIDEETLAQAKIGEYPKELLKNLSPERLIAYFDPTQKGFKIKKTLAAQVIFRKHNLLSDVYASGYDLIVCRNATIYFTSEAQDFCYQGFSRSLNTGGVLFIGASENIFNYRKYNLERICPSFFRKI